MRVASLTPALAFASFAALTASTCPPGTGGGTPPAAAVTPVQVGITSADPTGSPAPAGAPALFTSILKFSIPTTTVFEIAEEGWLLPSNTIANCGDNGCYNVLSNVPDGTGTSTYVIQVWPQAYKRFADHLEYEITDVSLNSGFTGSQLASKALRLIITPGVGTTLGGQPLPFTVHGTPEWAAVNEADTLAFGTIGLSTQQDAIAYYNATGAPADFATWRTNHGFAATDDSKDDAKTYYFNAGDLALGRSMHMKIAPNNDIAYYVCNYPTVNDAVRGTNLIACVAMDYSPLPGGGARVMKFAVYLSDGSRQLSADLDGGGQKFVPNLCIICHGNAGYNRVAGNTDVGARFLPFDLANFQFDGTIGRPSQEPAFKQLNLGILQSNFSQAEKDLINAWYNDPTKLPPNTGAATENDAAVPDGYSVEYQFYLDVVRSSCRSCHVSRDGAKAFGSFQDMSNEGTKAVTFVCSTRAMPNAKVTYQRFWLTHLPAPNGNQIGAMKRSGLNGWSGGMTCPQ